MLCACRSATVTMVFLHVSELTPAVVRKLLLAVNAAATSDSEHVRLASRRRPLPLALSAPAFMMLLYLACQHAACMHL